MPTRRAFLKCLAATSAFAAARKNFFDFRTQSQLAADLLRPQFHLLPARNWMNDPDGPIYWRNRYHMFFQYNPHAAVWGQMHWAHAVSDDMLHWHHLPIALAPTPNGPDADGCFSGSAVIHEGAVNSLYTGVRTVAPSEATLRDGRHNFLETQCLAASRDLELRTWQKLPVPVLLPPRDPKLTGFRDPCLWRGENTWYMGVGSGQRTAGGQVLLYRSSDLRRWDFLHALAHGEPTGRNAPDPVDSGDMWECPDLFPLDKKHVLLYSTQRKVFWEIGDYDLREHLFHSQKRGLLDHGAFYAPKSQLDAKGRRILWGWIPETRSESDSYAAGWAGCMSLPRVLAINKEKELTMAVIPETDSLSALDHRWEFSPSASELLRTKFLAFTLPSAAAKLEIKTSDRPFALSLTDGSSAIVQISYRPANSGHELQLNSATAPLPQRKTNDHKFTIFLDASVIECFADESVALTTRVYRAPQSPLRLSASDADLSAVYSLSISLIRPISPDRLTT